MNLDVSLWKTFFLKDICQISMGNKMDFNKMSFENPKIAFVGRSDKNNGVADIVDVVYDKNNHIIKPYKAGCITVALGGTIGSAFIQTKDFYTSQNVAVLEFEDCVSEMAKLFISVLIMNECKYKYYPFGRELNTHIRNDFCFNLPIKYNSNGTPLIDKKCKYSKKGYIPDWTGMEKYIKTLHYKRVTTNNKPRKTTDDINVKTWGRFCLDDLFYIKKGKRLTAEEQEDGNYNYIGAIDSNNGVANHIAQHPIHDGNTISLSYNGSVGEAFYQQEAYWATDDVNALYCKYEGFNKYIGLFIVAVIRQEKYRFSYGRKWTLDNMKITEICLPIKHNNDGTVFIDKKQGYSKKGYVPDWQFMEKYIKSLPYGDRLDG